MLLWTRRSNGGSLIGVFICCHVTLLGQTSVSAQAPTPRSPTTSEPSSYQTAYVGLDGFKPPPMPSNQPSESPSIMPSLKAVSTSDAPSLAPSFVPSDSPSTQPSISPSKLLASKVTSDGPSLVPSVVPSSLANAHLSSDAPSLVPSTVPSNLVAATLTSDVPSLVPSIFPSVTSAASIKSDAPSIVPSSNAVLQTSDLPSQTPSRTPTVMLAAPSDTPSSTPSVNPSLLLFAASLPTSTPSATPVLSIVDTITLVGVTKTMDPNTMNIFEKTTQSFLLKYVPTKSISISQVTVMSQTLETSRRRRQLQQTGLGVSFTVLAFIENAGTANIDLKSVVASTFQRHQDAYDQLLFGASPFFSTLQPSTKLNHVGGAKVTATTRSGQPSKVGGTLSVAIGASVALLVSGIFASWFVRRSRSNVSGKSLDVDRSDDDISYAATATSPNSLEAANARGFGSSDDSEITESSLSSYSSGDSSEAFIVQAGSNRYGPNGERSVEEEIENLSKKEEQVSPSSEIGPAAIALSTCSSISAVSEFSKVKTKVTPRGTKFVQFQVTEDPPGVEEVESTSSRDEEEEEKERIAEACRDKCEDAPVATAAEKKEQPETPEPKNDDPPDEFTLSSFSTLSAALSCGFAYDAVEMMTGETPKQARLEDCDVNTPKGGFIQHNCTPDGTTFVQLNTDSAQDVGEVLSDLTDMEVKWEGNLDSKTTAVSKTPKTNNLQKFKKAPRKVIYQAGGRVEL